MSYHFNFNNFYEDHFKENKNLDHITLPNNLGSIDTYKEEISKDIFLFKKDMKVNKDFEMITDSVNDSNSMSINLGFEGDVYRYNKLINSEETNNPNTIVIEYKKQIKNLFKFKKNTQAKGIGIFIKDSFLEENFFCHLKDKRRIQIEENAKNHVRTLFKSSLANSKTLSLAKEIYNSPFSGILNNLYLQSRVYEIIYDEFLSIINEKDKICKQKIILTQNDIEALHKARALILKNKQNFSIPELARKVAINEKKLKYGFKQIFNTTPGTIMLEARMYEAKKLLETSEYNVTEISELTGYKYVQNFTSAFIKFFGISPKVLMKSRKYYY